MLNLTQPTLEEQAKLENIAKCTCPSCKSYITKVGEEMICEKCPFQIPLSMFSNISKQYGKEDGK